MRGYRLLLLALVAGCSGSKQGTTTPPQRQVLSEKDILQRSKPAIVRIEAGDGDQMQSGTGFFVDGSGLVATNLHVISGKQSIRVKLHDGETYPVTAVAGIDPGRDLAVMRIRPTRPVPALRLGDSSAVAAGDKIVAIGNPLGVFDYSVTDGLISQVRPLCTQQQVDLHNRSRVRIQALLEKGNDRTAAEDQELESLRCSQELTVLQISAPISQGSSGGPLFNQAGEVVGVTTAIITTGQNINLAIPANYLKPIIAAPAAIPMDEFAAKTAPLGEAAGDSGPRIVRNVPDHPVSIFDGCKPAEVEELVTDIWEAIDVGAPLYNKGDIEACFKVYNFLATRYERDDKTCKGVRVAFGDGLVRVNAFGTTAYKEKAWALRDTFDGLLKAAKSWAAANGRTPPSPSKK